MADLISAVTGNFTSAGTWGTVDSASKLDSEAGTFAVSVTTSVSASFTLGAATYDGVALKMSSVSASPTGTMQVIVRNANTATSEATVIINVADLPSGGSGTNALGWFFFKFPSTFAANGTDSRVLWISTSSGSMVNLYRDATAANASRRFRTTTTQAPASGNHLVICNQMTAAGASTAVTVTMDNTATTSFGPTVSGGPPNGIVISGGGTLTLGTASSTAYYLKWKGNMLVSGNGTVNLGTSGSRLVSSSSCVFEMDSTGTAGDSNIWVGHGGTFKAYAATKVASTSLTSDAAASATTLNVGSTTGWVVGDTVILAGTTRGGTESKAIATIPGGTSITVSATSNAHSGTSPIAGEVINLSRNIIFRGVSTTAQGWFFADDTAAVVLSYPEFTSMGINTGNKQGICIGTTTGSFLAEYCSLHDFNVTFGQYGFLMASGTGNNFTVDHCVGYNIFLAFFKVAATSGTNWFCTNNVSINCSTNGNDVGFNIGDMGGTLTGNTCVGSSVEGFSFAENVTGTAATPAQPSISGNIAHCCGSPGFRFNSTYINTIFGSLTSYRNNASGIMLQGYFVDTVFNSATFFGNTTYNIQFGQGGGNSESITFNNAVVNSDSAATTTNALGAWEGGIPIHATFNGCTFDQTSGIFARHANLFLPVTGSYILFTFNNCLLNPSSALVNGGFSTANFAYRNSFMAFQNYNQVSTDHRYYTPLQTITSDTVIYHTASPSERIAPNSSVIKSQSGVMTTSVASGATKAISVWVRKSKSTDASGVDYAGAQQRLVLKRNDSLGVTSDTVLATASAATGTWEQLSGTSPTASEDGVFEIVVDCDGTTAWINVDDFAAV